MAPLLKLVYLLGLAVVLFFLHDWRVLAAVSGFQLLLWWASRIPASYLVRIARRLAVFVTIVFIVYGATKTRGGGESDWRPLFLGLEVNVEGLWTGLAMGLRVLALILASTWVQRSGAPGDFGRAMVSARIPRGLAYSIDGTLTLLTAEGTAKAGGMGRGDGSGSGQAEKKRFTFAQLRRGDFGFLREALARGIDRASVMVRRDHPDLAPERARDLAIVSGISLAAMGLKMIQIMPALPIAPGQKNLVLIPFFLLGSAQTTSRFGGLWCGATVGLLSFFLGFGKWGILEIGHFIAPGLLGDLLLPLVRGRGLLKILQLSLLGALCGAARFAAQFSVILLAGGNLGLFAVYSPMLVSQICFGAGSGVVSAFLLGAGERLLSGGVPPDAEERGGGGGGGGRGDGRGRRRNPDSPEPAPPGGHNQDVKQAS